MIDYRFFYGEFIDSANNSLNILQLNKERIDFGMKLIVSNNDMREKLDKNPITTTQYISGKQTLSVNSPYKICSLS